jgi:hypothetical protein
MWVSEKVDTGAETQLKKTRLENFSESQPDYKLTSQPPREKL